METLKAPSLLAGRVLLALMFVIMGYGKIGGYDGTVGYMESYGVPGILLPLVIAAELGGGLLIAVGFFSRWTALALAGFCILTAFMFHLDFADLAQKIQFLKNLSIAGGMLMLFAVGPGKYAINDK
jgi:putative oxidoreductase